MTQRARGPGGLGQLVARLTAGARAGLSDGVVGTCARENEPHMTMQIAHLCIPSMLIGVFALMDPYSLNNKYAT